MSRYDSDETIKLGIVEPIVGSCDIYTGESWESR